MRAKTQVRILFTKNLGDHKINKLKKIFVKGWSVYFI